MAAQLWTAPPGPLIGASGTALANSVTLTDISPGAAAGLIIPGGTLNVGTKIEVDAWGTFSNTGTPTLLVGVYYGGVAGIALAATTAFTTTTGATNWTWRIQYDGAVQVIGSGTAGKIIGAGMFENPTALTTFSGRRIPETAPVQVNIDTTINKAITIGAQWGAASASNTITCHYIKVLVHG